MSHTSAKHHTAPDHNPHKHPIPVPIREPRLVQVAMPPVNAFDLNDQTLAALKDKGVKVPGYDRMALKPGIVAIGGTSRLMGGLVYDMVDDALDARAEAGQELKFGVVGVSFSPPQSSVGGRETTQQLLNRQDNLYTVVKRGCVDSEVTSDFRVIGCVKEMLYIGEQRGKIIDQIASPETRVVTMAITAKNYFFSKDGIGIDLQHPEATELRRDLQLPQQPCSGVGLLVEGLRQRMIRNPEEAVTVLCCDNLPQPSGVRVKSALLSFISNLPYPESERDELSRWVTSMVNVPNVMVDRIVPEPDQACGDFVASQHGYNDGRVLFTEPDSARQIIIEFSETDTNPASREFRYDGPFTGVKGVRFTDPLETPKYGVVKEAMVNATHVWGAVMGEFFMDNPAIHEVLGSSLLSEWCQEMLNNELMPSLKDHVPAAMALDSYRDLVVERFENAGLPDHVHRISKTIAGRIPRLLKIVDRQLDLASRNEEMGISIERTCDAIAGWIITRSCRQGPFGRTIRSDLGEQGWSEMESSTTNAKFNDAKRVCGFDEKYHGKSINSAMHALFERLCVDRVFGGTGDSPEFKSAMHRAIERMCSYVTMKPA